MHRKIGNVGNFIYQSRKKLEAKPFMKYTNEKRDDAAKLNLYRDLFFTRLLLLFALPQLFSSTQLQNKRVIFDCRLPSKKTSLCTILSAESCPDSHVGQPFGTILA
jgi:hypothetical protein